MPVSYSGTAITWPDSSTTTSGWTGFKNRIINGAMMIDQRNAGASVSVSTSGVYVLDRWKNRANGGGVFTVQQSSTAPAGFTNSTVYTVTTPDSSIAAGDNYWILQDIEGYNVADLGFGTANAQTVTLSFWVRSSITGTYSALLSNGSSYDRSYVATFTISSANTFEYKTITIAGDTSGTWGKTNGGGLTVGFNLGAGSTYQTTAGSWQSGFLQATSSTTQWIATNGATFYITGVQLERGSTASSFEYVDYGRQLIQCQRYFSSSFPIGTAPAGGLSTYIQTSSSVAILNSLYLSFIAHPVQMRATPTITFYNTSSNTVNAGQWTWFSSGAWNTVGAGGTILNQSHPVGFEVQVNTGGGTTLNASYTVNGNYTASAEL